MKKLLLVCVVVAVFAVAFVVGRLSAPDAFSSAGGGLLPGPGESLTTERVAVVVRETPVPAAEGVQAAENRGEPVEGEAEAVVAGQTRPAQEAILAAIGTPSPFVRELKLHALVQDIPASEMPALIAAFEAQPPKVRNEAQNLLLERWVELSPRAAVTWALAQKRKNPYDVPFLGKIFNTWAAVDPSRAAAAASALGEDKQRRVALQAVVNAVAQTDFRQARQLLDQHTDVLTDRWRYRSVFRPWAETDPQEAYREAMTLADVDHRWGAVNAVIDVWAMEDPHAALEAAMTAERGNERRNLIRGPQADGQRLSGGGLGDIPQPAGGGCPGPHLAGDLRGLGRERAGGCLGPCQRKYHQHRQAGRHLLRGGEGLVLAGPARRARLPRRDGGVPHETRNAPRPGPQRVPRRPGARL
jgi:hypothetical protein